MLLLLRVIRDGTFPPFFPSFLHLLLLLRSISLFRCPPSSFYPILLHRDSRSNKRVTHERQDSEKEVCAGCLTTRSCSAAGPPRRRPPPRVNIPFLPTSPGSYHRWTLGTEREIVSPALLFFSKFVYNLSGDLLPPFFSAFFFPLLRTRMMFGTAAFFYSE